jgi:hypothetical protein
LSRGSNPAGYPTKPLVSYQIHRHLSGWNLPPLAIRTNSARTDYGDTPGLRDYGDTPVITLFQPFSFHLEGKDERVTVFNIQGGSETYIAAIAWAARIAELSPMPS